MTVADTSTAPVRTRGSQAATTKPSRVAAMFERVAPPLVAGLLFLVAWEVLVHLLDVSRFILPPPSAIALSVVKHFPVLMEALGFTAQITLVAFAAAVILGVTTGVLIIQNAGVERMVWPYAVALQVTPMIAIAPLVVIWVWLDRVWLSLMILATIVAYFPMLSNTVIGLKSADRGLSEMFTLYRATRWQRFRYLQMPTALPFILGGARISAGLSAIGGVVAEFVAGSGASNGLAWQIIHAGSMLDVPRMFAALFVLSCFGLAAPLPAPMCRAERNPAPTGRPSGASATPRGGRRRTGPDKRPRRCRRRGQGRQSLQELERVG